MTLKYDNKEIKIVECKSFYSRFKGFMFKKNFTHALLFNNCNSIHTFFMKQNIDVIMCDKDNNIIYYNKNLKKTIELPVGYFDFKTKTKVTID